MNDSSLLNGLAVALLAFLLGAGAVWLYDQAELRDAGPARDDLKSQMMRRKSDAMQDLLDAVLAGRLKRVAEGVDRLEQYAGVIDGFLATDMYTRQGAAWTGALADLRAAAAADDWPAVREATLAVERACLDCHQLLLATDR